MRLKPSSPKTKAAATTARVQRQPNSSTRQIEPKPPMDFAPDLVARPTRDFNLFDQPSSMSAPAANGQLQSIPGGVIMDSAAPPRVKRERITRSEFELMQIEAQKLGKVWPIPPRQAQEAFVEGAETSSAVRAAARAERLAARKEAMRKGDGSIPTADSGKDSSERPRNSRQSSSPISGYITPSLAPEGYRERGLSPSSSKQTVGKGQSQMSVPFDPPTTSGQSISLPATLPDSTYQSLPAFRPMPHQPMEPSGTLISVPDQPNILNRRGPYPSLFSSLDPNRSPPVASLDFNYDSKHNYPVEPSGTPIEDRFRQLDSPLRGLPPQQEDIPTLNLIDPSLAARERREQIAAKYRTYQEPLRLKIPKEERTYKCTLGCQWSHDSKANWRKHETSHFPQAIYFCNHRDCRGMTTGTNSFPRKDLLRRHYSSHHQTVVTDQDLETAGCGVRVSDSLFPRECVFAGCWARFETFGIRLAHIEAHLSRKDFFQRIPILKHMSRLESKSPLIRKKRATTESSFPEQGLKPPFVEPETSESVTCKNCGSQYNAAGERMFGECHYHYGDLVQKIDGGPHVATIKDRAWSLEHHASSCLWTCCGESGAAAGCRFGKHLASAATEGNDTSAPQLSAISAMISQASSVDQQAPSDGQKVSSEGKRMQDDERLSIDAQAMLRADYLGYFETSDEIRDNRQGYVGTNEDLELRNNLDLQETRNLDFFTDSGYASATNKVLHDKKTIAHASTGAEELYDQSGAIANNDCAENDASSTAVERCDAQMDDVKTVYSDASSISVFRKDGYIAELANDLYSRAYPTEDVDNETVQRLASVLPELLKAFALRVGYQATTSMHREIMLFVHRYRRDITDCFEGKHHYEEDISNRHRDKMPLNDIMAMWQVSPGDGDERPQVSPKGSPRGSSRGSPDVSESVDTSGDDGEEDLSPELPELDNYRKLVSDTMAYDWLCTRLQREILATPGGSDCLNSINAEISSWLPLPSKISRRSLPAAQHIKYEVDLDLLAFFKCQEYNESPSEAILNALTITGNDDFTQALTCCQYLRQTWPSTASYMIQALRTAIDSQDGFYSGVSPDGTELDIRIGARLIVEARGSRPCVIEIGEQIAWLGAALRSSPSDVEIADCQSSIRRIADSKSLDDTGSRALIPTLIHCEIYYSLHLRDDCTTAENGQCWQNLLGNPVVVRGFPIRRRCEIYRGLEIPLDVIAALANAQRVTRFQEQLIIKGFSTLLVAVKEVQNTMVWHLLYNADGSHISYTDPRVRYAVGTNLEPTSTPALETSRHILGWCSNVNNYVGAPDANYVIEPSRLRGPSTGCAFEKVTITAGQYLTAGVEASIGKKDKAVHLRGRNDYVSQLKWISKKYVVLFDVEEQQRGWLVDGSSALLHLVRASLKHDETDDFQSLFLFDSKNLKETSKPYAGKAAAIEVLTNPDNLKLKLYPKPADVWNEETTNESGASHEQTKRKTGYLLLKDRIEQIYHILEQVVCHQAHTDTENGVGFKVKRSPRRQLEGFDFMDIATDDDPIWPRMTTLETMGKGWVDFARAIHAITLFGNGFGELIKPVNASMLCQAWTEVPRMKDYLTVCVSQLKDILKKQGDTKARGWRVVDDIYWHNPSKAFERCEAWSRPKDGECCDRVQVLLPAALQNKWGKGLRSPRHLEDHGALIFGHSNAYKWYWRQFEKADKSIAELSTASSAESDTQSQSHDSGLGSSLTSDSLLTRTPSQQGCSFTTLNEPVDSTELCKEMDVDDDPRPQKRGVKRVLSNSSEIKATRRNPALRGPDYNSH